MSSTLRSSAIGFACLMLFVLSAGDPAAQTPATTACNKDTHVHRGEPWASQGGGTGVGFRVWAYCDGNEQRDLALVASMIDSFWAEMIAYMGAEPHADPGGSYFGGLTTTDRTRAVDFYLTVPVKKCDAIIKPDCVPPKPDKTFDYCKLSPHVPMRNDTCQFIAAADAALALAQPDLVPPIGPHGGSGFVLVDRTLLNEPTARGTLVHEFFHLLQFRYNRDLVKKTLTADDQNIRNWFMESTAVWAEARFNPATRAEVHSTYFSAFVEAGAPLDKDDPPSFAYAAYIWPFFMEQEAGKGSIAAVWKALAGVLSDDEVLETVAKTVSFKEHFRKFSVRNLNRSYDGAVTPLYSAADLTFPKTPTMENRGPVLPGLKRGAPPIEYHPKVPALTARYYPMRVGTDVQQLTLDATGLAPEADIDVDVLLKIRNKTGSIAKWELRPVHGKVRFCRSDPKDDVEELIVVLSNHSIKHQDVAGILSVAPQFDACNGWQGAITYTETKIETSTITEACGLAIRKTTEERRYNRRSVANIQVSDDEATYNLSIGSNDAREGTTCAGNIRTSLQNTENASGGGKAELEIRLAEDAPYYQFSFTMPEVQGTSTHKYIHSTEGWRNASSTDVFSGGISTVDVSCIPAPSAKPALQVVTQDDDTRTVCEVDSWTNPRKISGTHETTISCPKGASACVEGVSSTWKTVVTWRLTRH